MGIYTQEGLSVIAQFFSPPPALLPPRFLIQNHRIDSALDLK